MYRAFYGLKCDPFDKGVEMSRIYESTDFKEFSSRMEYFRRVKGFALALGQPGSGKTTSARAFVSRLNPQLYRIVYLPLASLTVVDFYRHLAVGFGLVPRYRKVDLFHQIQEFIVNCHHQKNITPFVVIDEAQFLPNEVLHDLRMLFNFHMDSCNYAMVLLLAQTHFAAHLNLHIHEALRQRIVVHYEFTGLTKSEVEQYISSLLSSAGAQGPIFTQDALEAIAASSQGLPRKVNLIAEKALILGASLKAQAIDSEVIQKVQQDLAPLEP